jgi:putative transposase
MRKRPGPDRIASILREIQADLDAGLNVDQACRKAGMASTTYLPLEGTPGEPHIE